MTNEFDADDQVCHPSKENSSKDEYLYSEAQEWIEEFEQRIKAGENPDPQEYIDRFQGSGSEKEEFRQELYMSALLTIYGLYCRQKKTSRKDRSIEST